MSDGDNPLPELPQTGKRSLRLVFWSVRCAAILFNVLLFVAVWKSRARLLPLNGYQALNLPGLVLTLIKEFVFTGPALSLIAILWRTPAKQPR